VSDDDTKSTTTGFRIGGGVIPMPRVELIDCEAAGGDTGMVIGPNARVRSKGFRAIDNNTGIDNHGEFDGPDTIIE
jgi:hypothetical protein